MKQQRRRIVAVTVAIAMGVGLAGGTTAATSAELEPAVGESAMPPASAKSTFEPIYGSPGLIARVAAGGHQPLQVWDAAKSWTTPKKGRPVYDPDAAGAWSTLVPRTVSQTDMLADDWFGSAAIRSTPQWSPDGTKIAYVATTDYSGNGYKITGVQITPPYFVTTTVVRTTAVFVYDLLTKTSRQVSEPIPGRAFCGGKWAEICGSKADPETGHVFADTNPFWTQDGKSITFIRYGDTARDDDFVAHRGYNLWTVPIEGGEGQALTAFGGGDVIVRDTGEAVPGTDHAIVRLSNTKTRLEQLRLIHLTSGVLGPVYAEHASSGGDVIGDFDVSPDGSELAFTVVTIADPDPASRAVTVTPLAEGGRSEMQFGWPGTFVRFSPTGSGLLKAGCVDEGRRLCGIVEHLMLPEEEGTRYDVQQGETERLVFAHSTLEKEVNEPRAQRTEFDIQTQQIPVIFLHGFAGSEIACGNRTVWGGAAEPLGFLNDLDLDSTGRPICPGSKPTRLLQTLARTDVYGPTATFLAKNMDGAAGIIPWDWRRRPAVSIAGMNAAIKRFLNTPRARAQGQSRVMLYGHSYGGLLIRSYLEKHPQSVARVLTAGTPYFGSAKSMLPLLTGRESLKSHSIFGITIQDGLDLLLLDRKFAQFVRHLEGMYQLQPSASLGETWFRVDGRVLSFPRRLNFIFDHNGNTGMATAAHKEHARVWDFFWDANGVIDYRAVGSAGLATIRDIDLSILGEDVRIKVTYGNGDGTVLINSQLQTKVPESSRRAPVHRQTVCGVPHMSLASDPLVTDAYVDFLRYGSVPKVADARSCSSENRGEETVTLPLMSGY